MNLMTGRTPVSAKAPNLRNLYFLGIRGSSAQGARVSF